MVEKEKEMVRQQENLNFLKKQQEKTDDDICQIKKSLSNLDVNTTIMREGIERLVNENTEQDKRAEKRDKMVEEIFAEIRDVKRAQELDHLEYKRSEEILTEQVASINKELDLYKRELQNETQKLRDDIDTYINRTTFDWFDAFNEGIQSVLTEGMKLGAAAMIIYSMMKLAEKFK